MKRAWWLARVRFHDWMWDGGSRSTPLRRMARRLPLYFSDPYWMKPSEVERVFREGAVYVTTGPSTNRVTVTNCTYSAATTYSATWPPVA